MKLQLPAISFSDTVYPLLFATLCLCLLATGCSSTGTHAAPSAKDKRVTKAVYLGAVPGDLSALSAQVTAFLEGVGFVMVEEKTTDCLVLEFVYNPDVWNKTVGVELRNGNRVLVSSKAVNQGWGTVIASSSALANLCSSANLTFQNHCKMWLREVQLRDAQTEARGPAKKPGRPGQGTGFCVAPDGRILTAAHVVDGASKISVKFADGVQWGAKIEKIDLQNDLALLKTERKTPEFLEVSNPKDLAMGQQVYTLGFPATGILGEQVKFTGGQISSMSGIRGTESLMQITVPVHPGNSGGPLLTEDGKVVGVITSTAGFQAFFHYTGTLPQNINWAVKSSYALLLFDAPIEKSPLNPSNKPDMARAVCQVICED